MIYQRPRKPLACSDCSALMDAVIAARVDSRLLATRSSSSIYVKNQRARLSLFVFFAVVLLECPCEILEITVFFFIDQFIKSLSVCLVLNTIKHSLLSLLLNSVT